MTAAPAKSNPMNMCIAWYTPWVLVNHRRPDALAEVSLGPVASLTPSASTGDLLGLVLIPPYQLPAGLGGIAASLPSNSLSLVSIPLYQWC
jgi:hypothetical protein